MCVRPGAYKRPLSCTNTLTGSRQHRPTSHSPQGEKAAPVPHRHQRACVNRQNHLSSLTNPSRTKPRGLQQHFAHIRLRRSTHGQTTNLPSSVSPIAGPTHRPLDNASDDACEQPHFNFLMCLLCSSLGSAPPLSKPAVPAISVRPSISCVRLSVYTREPLKSNFSFPFFFLALHHPPSRVVAEGVFCCLPSSALPRRCWGSGLAVGGYSASGR